MKKTLILILFICGFGLFFYNCQRDVLINTTPTEALKSQFKTKIIKLADIPNVKSYLLSKSKNSLFSQKSTIDSAIFEQDNILEVIDTLNNTNYTFKFTFPSTPRGVFYNLVVGKSPDGTLLEPFVLKFVSDSTHLNEFIANDYKFSYFRGQMEVHKFTDYFQTGLGLKTEATSCTPAFDAFGDPIPCDVVSFPGSGPSSGGGTTSSSGGSTGTTTCSWYVTYLPCGCGGNADGHAPSGVSCCQGSPSILTKVCSPSLKMPTANKTTSTINPCPDCPNGNNGGVGVSLSDKLPCPGNPVPNPEIAPQKGASGIKGAMFGCTRFDSDEICEGVKGSQYHNGIDLKSAFGDPIYAMYDGTSRLDTQYDKKGVKVVGAGHYVEVKSVINGQVVKILYFHMQKDNRKEGAVKVGDIIGFQGDSGNLKGAIKKGNAESHLHVKTKVNNVEVDPNTYLATKFDPNTGQITLQPKICN